MIFREVVLRTVEDVIMNSEPVLARVYSVFLKEKSSLSDHADLFYDGEIIKKLGQSVCGKPGIVDVKNFETTILLDKCPGRYRNKELIKKGTMVGTISTVVDVMCSTDYTDSSDEL